MASFCFTSSLFVIEAVMPFGDGVPSDIGNDVGVSFIVVQSFSYCCLQSLHVRSGKSLATCPHERPFALFLLRIAFSFVVQLVSSEKDRPTVRVSESGCGILRGRPLGRLLGDPYFFSRTEWYRF
jgi:hypothetical protein